MIYAGIDAGSRAIKIALLDDNMGILKTGVTDQGVNQVRLTRMLLENTLQNAEVNPGSIIAVVSTGCGRDALDFADTAITEITCHAKGVSHLMKNVMTIVDIGGQDSKVIRLDQDSRVRDFKMNDRCAAGTGRFLEVVANRLEVNIDAIGEIIEKADDPANISSMCVVFAETEIIGLLASGKKRENILAGVQKSIASRIASMAGRSVDDPIFFTGGVARIPGMDKALEKALNHAVQISTFPQYTGAIGAALLARERYPS